MRILLLVLALAWTIPLFAEDSKTTWQSPGVPAAPGEFWKIPAGEAPRLTGATPSPAPPDIQNKIDWRLSDLIDFALKTAYDTKASFYDTKAAEAEFKSKKGAWYPEVNAVA